MKQWSTKEKRKKGSVVEIEVRISEAFRPAANKWNFRGAGKKIEIGRDWLMNKNNQILSLPSPSSLQLILSNYNQKPILSFFRFS